MSKRSHRSLIIRILLTTALPVSLFAGTADRTLAEIVTVPLTPGSLDGQNGSNGVGGPGGGPAAPKVEVEAH